MAKNELKELIDAKGKVDEAPVEKTGIGDRLRAMRDRLKLGPHHKMERFTVLLGATLSFLLIFTAVGFTSHRVEMASQASAQSVLSTEFTFSLSGQIGKVQGVYGDEARQDVMMLFRLEDPKGMSADANNYELFITGEKDELAVEPDVSFSLFGSTGYGMIRFQSDEGLPNEAMKITIRSNSELVTGNTPVAADIVDESFAENDQAQLFVNPGADEITILDGVKAGEGSPEKLYTALVAETLDEDVRERIKETTATLSQLLNRSDEYTNRLVSSGYKPPTTPWFIDGDYVDEDGNFVAAKYLSKAHKVDYATHTIWDGYINQVADNLSGFDAYMEKVNAEAETTVAKDDQLSEQVEPIKTIQREDGSTLNLETITTGTSPTAQVAAKDSVDSLTSVWRSYVTEKGKLQRDLMLELLVLDADVLSQPSIYSENTNDKLVIFY